MRKEICHHTIYMDTRSGSYSFTSRCQAHKYLTAETNICPTWNQTFPQSLYGCTQKKALHILVLGWSITTCTDITFHNVNSGWAGFEIKKQWSRNLADFIIIINKLSNFSSVQQQQKKKVNKKENKPIRSSMDSNKQTEFYKKIGQIRHTSPSVGCNRSSGMSCTAGRRLGTLRFKNKTKQIWWKKRHFNEAERLIYKQGGQRSPRQASTVRRGMVHVVYSKLSSLSIVHMYTWSAHAGRGEALHLVFAHTCLYETERLLGHRPAGWASQTRPALQNHRLYVCVYAFSEPEVTVSEREGRVVNCVSVHTLPVSVKGNACNTFTTRGQNSSRGCTEMFLPSLTRLRTCS